MALCRSRPYLSTMVSFAGPSPSLGRTSAMKPSDLRMSATASLRRLAGTSVRSCLARPALRIRVSMSAIGSVIMASPTGLDHAGELSAEREHPKADPAKLEVAVIRARATTNLATVPVPRGELLRAVQLCKLFCTGHRTIPRLVPERDAQLREEGAPLLVGARSGDERDVHPLHDVDLVVVDLGEDDLLAQTHRVVPLPVEALAADAFEVADAGQSERDQ